MAIIEHHSFLFYCILIYVFQISVAIHTLLGLSDDGKVPYILCGDCNVSPVMPGYYYIAHGHLNDEMKTMASKKGAGVIAENGSVSSSSQHVIKTILTTRL